MARRAACPRHKLAALCFDCSRHGVGLQFIGNSPDADMVRTALRSRKDFAMIPHRLTQKVRRFKLRLGMGSVAALILLTAVSAWSAQNPAPARSEEAAPPSSAINNQPASNTPKSKEEPKKSSPDKRKTDAAELSALADQLRDQLNKTNVNILSLDILQKTEEIEKLAKKIKGEADAH